MGSAMRVAYGRKAVEPGLMEELPNNKFKLEDFFDVVDMVQKKIFQKVLRLSLSFCTVKW